MEIARLLGSAAGALGKSIIYDAIYGISNCLSRDTRSPHHLGLLDADLRERYNRTYFGSTNLPLLVGALALGDHLLHQFVLHRAFFDVDVLTPLLKDK